MLQYSYEQSIYEVKELEEKMKNVCKKLLQQSHKMKVIEKFSKQEEIDYELLKGIFRMRSINLEEIYIKLAKEKDKFYIQMFDEKSFEEKEEMQQAFNKKDLEIRLNKKVKAFY